MRILPKISLRKASFSDIEFLWYLRNQHYVYKNSRIHKPVDWKDHINWIMPILLGFKKKDFFIIECSNKKAGQIRFDYKNKEAEVSISLLEEFCGRGIGSRALKLAIARIEKKAERVMAEVKKDNTASIKLFKKLDFKRKSQKGEWFQYVLKICKEKNEK
jgi:RimJ/RimL family protein N-acetyltransferase